MNVYPGNVHIEKIKSIGQFYKDSEPYDVFKEFNDWCKREGVICPKIEFPAYFENGL